MDYPIKRRIVIQSPAKVNLFLGIGARRDDGYHDADTILHTIDLCDTLTFDLCDSSREKADDDYERLVLTCMPDLGINPRKNLIYRAIDAYAKALGRPMCASDERICVHADKVIPAQAGLGGGSSNAAAALMAAALLWGINPREEKCISVAESLGADVPFFLHGGCVHMTGRGDVLVKRHDALSAPIVIVKPRQGVSTKEAYEEFDRNPLATKPVPSKPIALERITFFNNLEPAAFVLLPELAAISRWLNQQEGLLGSLLCGSGSALFAICESEEAATKAREAAQARGLWAVTTRMRPTGVTVMEDTLQKTDAI